MLVIQLDPLFENEDESCSSSAEVRFDPDTKVDHGGKIQALVTAEDVNSAGHTLRAQVIVKAIHSLQIVSHTKEVLLEEAPVKFLVSAFDDRGNQFSTLSKVVFKWDTKDRDDVLR